MAGDAGGGLLKIGDRAGDGRQSAARHVTIEPKSLMGVRFVDARPLRFIGEPVEVQFDTPPLLEKQPTCPDRFVWRGETHRIAGVLGEWRDFGRRGRMARNMAPAHAAVAAQRGSWGVGRFYFCVRTGSGRVFDLYYDRAPKDAETRKGAWFLYRELAPDDDQD